MQVERLIKKYDAFIFELDNVIYPEKDYDLQVYYLFAQFIEYALQLDAAEVLSYMKEAYELEGAEGIFDQTAKRFNLPAEYQVNFSLLEQGAKLPLKLLLFDAVLQFIKQLINQGKSVYLLTNGEPLKQLNKIKQTEWYGIAQYLTVYFTKELSDGLVPDALNVVMEKHSLNPEKVVFFDATERDQKGIKAAGVKLLLISKLFAL